MRWTRIRQARCAALRPASSMSPLLPIAVATVSKVEVMSIWAMGGMTLVPVVLLGSPLMTLPRRAARRIVMVALAVPLIALALSPLIAVVIHRQGTPNYSAHYRAVALAVEKARHEASPGPLRLVGSYNNLLYGTVFYFRDRPSTFEIARPEVTPWTDEARIAREGIALFCPTVESVCMKALNERAERSRVAARVEVDISRAFAGASDAPVRYVIVIVPPRD